MTRPGDFILPDLLRRWEGMPLTPSFLIAVAGALVGVKEEGGKNRGPMVDRFLAATGLEPGRPWCAAFVAYAGYSHTSTRRMRRRGRCR